MKQILYSLNIPTKVYYGRGVLEISLEKVQKECSWLSGNILIVTTGRSLKRLGYIERLINYFKRISTVTSVEVFDDISANPILSEINEAISLGKEVNSNIIVGFGGGSALDAAKAVAAGIPSETSIYELFRRNIEPKTVLPIIAIPTTAGTGSELSKAAILNDEEEKTKGGLRGTALFPQIAIVDSVFTESVPFHITMETGFDVLAHAIESYVATSASPFSEMLSEYVIKEGTKSIKKLVENLDDIEAREKMSFCSMIMGMNLGNTGTGLPHRMQYPIGSITNSSHGEGLAILYPAWIRYEKKYSEEKMEKVFSLMEVSEIEELLDLMKLRKNLRMLGIDESELQVFHQRVTGNIANDPVSVEDDVIQKIYMESY